MVGLPSSPPADWQSGSYFFVKQEVYGAGEWWCEDGGADLRVTSDNPVTVRLIPNYAGNWITYIFVGFFVWILGILFFAILT